MSTAPDTSKTARALAVFVLDPTIRSWLATNDPKALTQAERALQDEPAWEAECEAYENRFEVSDALERRTYR